MKNQIPKTVLDLFCGCGGLSAGFQMAGYEVKAGLDVDKKYISSFIHNFPNSKAITDSIVDISPEEFCSSIGLSPEDIGVLVGGPPCQGFSKNVPRKHRYLEDPKNSLVKLFLDYAVFIRPPIVVMENVAEMKNGFDGHYTDEVVERLSAAGYSVTHCVLNAADYGVPQRRRRAFFLANRLGLHFRIPETTHNKPVSGQNTLFPDKHHISAWDAFGDLPSLMHGEGQEITSYACPAFSEYQKLMRNRDGKVRNHIARQLKPLQYERLSALEPGQGLKDLPEHLRTKGGYSGAYGRLTKEMISPTITRWVFHPGSGRWGHPSDIRLISIREVARIQGFPDSFEFVGTYNDQAGQLGNAVPPLLAFKIIRDLESQLRGHSSPNIVASSSNDIFSETSGRTNLIEFG